VMPQPLADADNALPIYAQFGETFDAAMTEDDRSKYRLFTAHSPEVLSFLKRQEKALALARRAADMPACRLDLDYSHPQFVNLVPTVSQFRNAGILLSIAAREEDGRPAIEDCSRTFSVGRHSQSLPWIINGLIGFVIDNLACRTTAEVLPVVTAKGDLAQLRIPQSAAMARDFARMVRNEEAYGLAFFADNSGEYGGPLAWIIWYREDVALYRERLQQIQEDLKKPYFKTTPAARISLPGGMMSALAVPSLRKSAGNIASVQALNEAALIAIAATQHRLDKGSYPAELSALVPTYLPEMPVDPFDGKPMRKKKRDDGSLVIYSVNSDGVDNGGDVDSTKADGAKDAGLVLRAPTEPRP
jgi:hypothetical protein